MLVRQVERKCGLTFGFEQTYVHSWLHEGAKLNVNVQNLMRIHTVIVMSFDSWLRGNLRTYLGHEGAKLMRIHTVIVTSFSAQ